MIKNYLTDLFPDWKLIEENGTEYALFTEIGRAHKLKVQVDTKSRKFVRYIDTRYYL